jgi:hypothetical protein
MRCTLCKDFSKFANFYNGKNANQKITLGRPTSCLHRINFISQNNKKEKPNWSVLRPTTIGMSCVEPAADLPAWPEVQRSAAGNEYESQV